MQERRSNRIGRNIVAVSIVCALAVVARAQAFNSSGSTGADGNLIVNAPGVTTFTATPVGGGNVYNFGTIQIATGSTLKLSGAVFQTPLYFLATGAVTVSGTIDLSGQSGSASPPTAAQRTGPTVPGSGGYGGGPSSFGSNPADPGLGPAGGAINACEGNWSAGGGFSGNQFLVPLVGGSGGGGNSDSGGAGGGALLIASSVSITVNGTITANGGGASDSGNNGLYPGAGAGGAIRLVAPLIAGNGAVTAAGGVNPQAQGCTNGANGIVRLEAYTITYTGSYTYTATPVGVFLPGTSAPSIVVASIGGVPVNPSPTGSFVVPDVVVNSTSPLTVQIQAANIPLGTTATLFFTTENFPDQKIISTALAGTLASSTATATVTLQPGYSIGYITATWTQ